MSFCTLSKSTWSPTSAIIFSTHSRLRLNPLLSVSLPATEKRTVKMKSLSFSIDKSCPLDDGPRLGKLSYPDRTTIETPHYLATSSRGCVPHLSQDVMRGSTNIRGIYAALEDCELPPRSKGRRPIFLRTDPGVGASKSLRSCQNRFQQFTRCPLHQEILGYDVSSRYRKKPSFYLAHDGTHPFQLELQIPTPVLQFRPR